jgi:hypothetical protein
MNFSQAEHVNDLIWWEGPLLSLYTLEGKLYLIVWTDVDEKNHKYLIAEVSLADLVRFLSKNISLLDVQEKSPTLWVLTGDLQTGELKATTPAEIDDDLKAPVTSFFDETLTYETMYPKDKNAQQ